MDDKAVYTHRMSWKRHSGWCRDTGRRTPTTRLAPLLSTAPRGPRSPAVHTVWGARLPSPAQSPRGAWLLCRPRRPRGVQLPCRPPQPGARLPCGPHRCPPEGEAPLGSQSRCRGAFPALGSAVHPAPSLPCSQDSCSSATSHACFPSPDGATAWVPPQHIHSWGATPGLPAKEAIQEYLPTEGCPMMLLYAGNE